MITSKHAIKRVRKRIGIKKKAVNNMRDSAFIKGVTHAGAKGKLKRYISKLYLTHNQGNNIRIYANYVWVFQNKNLITVFPVPSRLIKQAIGALK